MKKNYVLMLMLLLAAILIFNAFYISLSATPVNVYANSMVNARGMAVMEVSSKRLLLNQNSKTKMAMASTTKIMTALVAIENTQDLDKEVKIYDEAVGIEGTSIYLRKGETMTMRDLLYGLMLASGNDASVAIAAASENGNTQAFVDKMNKKALELGANDTKFANPHGLDAKQHYTTAYDLALITCYAMQNDTFREIAGTRKMQIKSTPEGHNRFLVNKQKLLRTYEGATGVKTGFTDDAGRCSVSSAKKDGMEIVCVVLNAPNMFGDSSALLNKAFETYEMVELLKPYSFGGVVDLDNNDKRSVKIYSERGFSYPLKAGEKNMVKVSKTIPQKLSPPLKKQEAVGKIEIYLNKDLLFEENVYTIESVETLEVSDKVKELIEKWFLD